MNTKMSRAEKFVSSLAVAVVLAGFAADGIRDARHTVPHRPMSMTEMAGSGFAATTHPRRAAIKVAAGGSGGAGNSLQ
jgi:hypothetical protein